MAKAISKTAAAKQREKELNLLYEQLDEYQKIDEEYNRLGKLRTTLGTSLKDQLEDGTFVLQDLSITKKTVDVHATDKKLVEKMVKEIGREDILEAAMTISQRVTLSVKRSTPIM